MSDLDGLLQAVRDHPDDDGVRLVVADWLEEHGDEADRARAEFIRTQIRLARLPRFHPESAHLSDRAEELLLDHQTRWLQPLLPVLHRWTFRRGFVERIRISPRAFCEQWQDLFRQHPITEIELTELADFEAFLACPGLDRVRALDFTQVNDESVLVDEKVVRLLASSPHLAQLRTLDLVCAYFVSGWARMTISDNVIDLEGLAALFHSLAFRSLHSLDQPADAEAISRLAQSPHAAKLTRLELEGVTIGSEGIHVIVSSPWLTRLTDLGLGNVMGSDDADAEALASWPGLARLTRSNLSLNGLSDSNVATLLRSPYLGNMVELDLRGNQLASESAAALASSPHLGNLRSLIVSDVDPEVARAIASSPSLTGLASLDLSRLTDDMAEALARADNLRGLTSLHLSSCACSERGLEMLATSEVFAGVVNLSIWTRQKGASALVNKARWRPRQLRIIGELGPEDAATLARSSCLSRLRDLYLGGGDIGNEGMASLANSGILENLQVLVLRRAGVRDEGVRLLASSNRLKRLRILDLCCEEITEGGLLALARSPLLGQLTQLSVLQWTFPLHTVKQALAQSLHVGNLIHLNIHGGPEELESEIEAEQTEIEAEQAKIEAELASRFGLALSRDRAYAERDD